MNDMPSLAAGSLQASHEQARALRSLEEQGYEKQRFRIPLVRKQALPLCIRERVSVDVFPDALFYNRVFHIY